MPLPCTSTVSSQLFDCISLPHTTHMYTFTLPRSHPCPPVAARALALPRQPGVRCTTNTAWSATPSPVTGASTTTSWFLATILVVRDHRWRVPLIISMGVGRPSGTPLAIRRLADPTPGRTLHFFLPFPPPLPVHPLLPTSHLLCLVCTPHPSPSVHTSVMCGTARPALHRLQLQRVPPVRGPYPQVHPEVRPAAAGRPPAL
jgi:hypothetical protein